MSQQVSENEFLDFKREISFERKIPQEKIDKLKPEELAKLRKKELDEVKEDWVLDLVAFANSRGGQIIIGLEADSQERAYGLNPMLGDQAKRLADRLRNLAIEWVRPPISQMEIAEFKIAAEEWIVIANVPDSQNKPHMCAYNDRTTFVIRDGNRKRTMTHDEIQRAFLTGPSERYMAQSLLELRSIGARLDGLEKNLRKAE